MAPPEPTKMDQIVNLCKRRGFIFPSAEIYGGYGGFWDWGPLGLKLKNNIKNAWWHDFVLVWQDVVGMDGSIMGSTITNLSYSAISRRLTDIEWRLYTLAKETAVLIALTAPLRHSIIRNRQKNRSRTSKKSSAATVRGPQSSSARSSGKPSRSRSSSRPKANTNRK